MHQAISEVSNDLIRTLEGFLGKSVDIKINQNRKTMLSVLEKGPKRVRLSMHEMFLKAPKEVVEAAASYIQTQSRLPLKVLQFYIHENLQACTTTQPWEGPLVVKGRFYDLEKEWEIVNRTYFKGKLKVNLTWYGKSPKHKVRSRVTLGAYSAIDNLIKLHVRLDKPEIPRYYIQFVLYHEALHKIYPPYLDESGMFKVHHETFKKHEKRFHEYDLVRSFERLAKKYWFSL